MRQLVGEVPRFDDALVWATHIRENGWTNDSYVRNYSAIADRLHSIYDVYLAVLSEA
jgi:hypothetical protein